MNHTDHVNLIRGGVGDRGGRWADLGSGEGAFTHALAELLGPEAHIVAVDKDRRALRALESGRPALRALDGLVETRVADFTRPLDLGDLDGILMANSLHYVRDKQPMLETVRRMLKPQGRLLIVEYGTNRGNTWVPYPFTYERWEKLAEQAGFVNTRLLATIPSRWLGSMYAAVSLAGPPSPLEGRGSE